MADVSPCWSRTDEVVLAKAVRGGRGRAGAVRSADVERRGGGGVQSPRCDGEGSGPRGEVERDHLPPGRGDDPAPGGPGAGGGTDRAAREALERIRAIVDSMPRAFAVQDIKAV